MATLDPRVDIGHVHLKVSDIDRALDFYVGVLGFDVMARMGDQAAFISAGFDAHERDPLAEMRVTAEGFRELAKRTKGLAPRVAAVLEGGYNLDTLPSLVGAALEGFA